MRYFQKAGLIFLLVCFCIAVGSQAGHWLVVDEPTKSDAIVVLAGETDSRPELALKLLNRGFAPHVFLDAERRNLIYDELLVDIAQRYVEARNESSRVSVCAIEATSTVSEVHDVDRCLRSVGAHKVLVVTSEFHTRRARMILRHGLPDYEVHIAAARNEWQFGEKWWSRREWAKTTFDEWLKIVWWQAVDRWRHNSIAD